MKFGAVFLTLIASTQACYLTVHSSKVGDFEVSHSEPNDNNGERQYVDWEHEGCHIQGEIFNGCGVDLSSSTGCGKFSMTSHGPL